MKRLAIILKENHTLHEMLVGTVFANCLLAVTAIFVNDRRSALLAVAIGCATAVIYVIHMAYTVDDALCLDEKGAASEMRKQMIIRYLFVCIIAGVSLYFKIADPVFFVISLITIKAGAYLQPTVHKIFNRQEER
jgi:mannose/fructose/N-acetylgalactosamine-specific phosphotransferase system component IIC